MHTNKELARRGHKVIPASSTPKFSYGNSPGELCSIVVVCAVIVQPMCLHPEQLSKLVDKDSQAQHSTSQHSTAQHASQ